MVELHACTATFNSKVHGSERVTSYYILTEFSIIGSLSLNLVFSPKPKKHASLLGIYTAWFSLRER